MIFIVIHFYHIKSRTTMNTFLSRSRHHRPSQHQSLITRKNDSKVNKQVHDDVTKIVSFLRSLCVSFCLMHHQVGGDRKWESPWSAFLLCNLIKACVNSITFHVSLFMSLFTWRFFIDNSCSNKTFGLGVEWVREMRWSGLECWVGLQSSCECKAFYWEFCTILKSEFQWCYKTCWRKYFPEPQTAMKWQEFSLRTLQKTVKFFSLVCVLFSLEECSISDIFRLPVNRNSTSSDVFSLHTMPSLETMSTTTIMKTSLISSPKSTREKFLLGFGNSLLLFNFQLASLDTKQPAAEVFIALI